jgi:hypothetical protein
VVIVSALDDAAIVLDVVILAARSVDDWLIVTGLLYVCDPVVATKLVFTVVAPLTLERERLPTAPTLPTAPLKVTVPEPEFIVRLFGD